MHSQYMNKKRLPFISFHCNAVTDRAAMLLQASLVSHVCALVKRLQQNNTVLSELLRTPIQLQCIFPIHFWPIQEPWCTWVFSHLQMNEKCLGYTAWASDVTQLFFSKTMCSLMTALRSVQLSKAQYVAVC